MVFFPLSLRAPRRKEGRGQDAHSKPAVSKAEGKTGPLYGNKKYFPRTHTQRNIIRPKYLSLRVCFPFPFIPGKQGLTGGNILGKGKVNTNTLGSGLLAISVPQNLKARGWKPISTKVSGKTLLFPAEKPEISQ